MWRPDLAIPKGETPRLSDERLAGGEVLHRQDATAGADRLHQCRRGLALVEAAPALRGHQLEHPPKLRLLQERSHAKGCAAEVRRHGRKPSLEIKARGARVGP